MWARPLDLRGMRKGNTSTRAHIADTVGVVADGTSMRDLPGTARIRFGSPGENSRGVDRLPRPFFCLEQFRRIATRSDNQRLLSSLIRVGCRKGLVILHCQQNLKLLTVIAKSANLFSEEEGFQGGNVLGAFLFAVKICVRLSWKMIRNTLFTLWEQRRQGSFRG